MNSNNNNCDKNNIRNLTEIFKLISEIDKRYILLIVFVSTLRSLKLLLNIYFPLLVINNLMSGNKFKLLYIIIGYLVINGITSIIINYYDSKLKIKSKDITLSINLKMGQKTMLLDYQHIEDPEVLDLKERALFPIKNQDIIPRMINEINNCIIAIFYLLAIILIISTVHFALVIIVLIVVLINSLISNNGKKIEVDTMKTVIPLNREFTYYMKVITDFTFAKDIRLYSINHIIIKRLKEYQKKSFGAFKGLLFKQGIYKGFIGINMQIQAFIISIILFYLVLEDLASIGELVIMLNATNSLSSTLQNLVSSFLNIRIFNKYLEPYFEIYNMLEENGSHEGIKINNIETIEFRNVSFCYPKSTEKVLDNISLKFENGKSYSLVGLNGAGKTTLIKLLCKLYRPTEGTILINEIDLDSIDHSSYMKQLSCVFQDFKLFAFTVKENVILNQHDRDDKTYEVLSKVGMENKVQKLKNKLDTSVFKIFDKEGIEFSGGESQKLAIARAIYKESSLMIFDEPTAALDPIIEYEIYEKLNDTLKDNKDGKITIFISHRLSSCKLCDFIYVLHDGKILQQGEFRELLFEQDNLFKDMWNAQAQYYV